MYHVYAPLTSVNAALRHEVVGHLYAGDLGKAIPDGVVAIPGHSVGILVRYGHVFHLIFRINGKKRVQEAEAKTKMNDFFWEGRRSGDFLSFTQDARDSSV